MSAGHPVRLEDWEYKPIANIVTRFSVNTPHAGATTNQYASFCRNPAPNVIQNYDEMMAADPDNREIGILNLKWELVRAWECTLVQIDEAQLYDGTGASAVAFEVATSLSPSKFARAWLEAEGSIWCNFHPSTPGGGPLLAEAMCEY